MTNRPAAIGTCLVFADGHGEFLARHYYAIVAIYDDTFYLVDIDFKNRAAARILRRLQRTVFSELEKEGFVSVQPLPPIPSPKSSMTADEGYEAHNASVVSWAAALRPMIEVAPTIFAAKDPVKFFNKLAGQENLHRTRARERFFWLAAYNFDEASLAPAYWNSGTSSFEESGVRPLAKRGRKLKDPFALQAGWPFDPAWGKPILEGWKRHARPGIGYIEVYVEILRTKFCCLSDTSCRPARIHQPDGKSFPKYEQFRYFIQKSIGQNAWRAAKYGEQTMRNRAGKATNKVGQYLINLLEEVQWDAQVLDELPGDLFDPTQAGKPIVRVVAICATCGGPVGLGYDYGGESQWAYLMALLCMAMKKSEFGELFGVEISDEDWPAVGLMLSVRGDRGPAIGQKISDIIAQVLEIWQQWAASYDPVGKPNAEAGHHKTTKVEGAPIRPKIHRSPMEIIREDLRKTVIRFQSDMSHRLDPDQARRLERGTPLTIWNDLASQSLYAGQSVPVDKMIRLTVPMHAVSIRHDGVYLGGVRYLSTELEESGLLERARGNAIASNAYVMHMVTKYIWLDVHGKLMKLTGVPVRINAMDATHSMTLEEALHYQELLNRSRRAVEEELLALNLQNHVEAAKDRQAAEKVRKEMQPRKSAGKRQTVKQHEAILKRKS
jgi:hypothetical protein